MHPLAGGPPAGLPTAVVDLTAGRTLPAGTVTCWLEGDVLHVQYQAQDGWVLDETQIAVAPDLAGIPVTRSGNPKVGHFPYKVSHEPAVTDYAFEIDLASLGCEGAPQLFVAAHAEVSLLGGEGEVIQREGAWAEGEPFPDLWPDVLPGIKKVEGEGPPDKDPAAGNWAMHFTLDMFRLRGLLLWNKLGSTAEIEHSQVGPGGTVVGDLRFLPCVYGNGCRAMPRTGDHNIPVNFVDYPRLNLGPRGTIEFWYHPDWNDWHVEHVVTVINYGVPTTGGWLLDMGYNDWQDLVSVQFRTSETGPYDYIQVRFRPSAMPEWTTAAPFHVAIVWDSDQPVAADRLRLYLNGRDALSMGASMVVSGDPKFIHDRPDAVLRVSERLMPGDWDRHHWEPDNGVYDNLKVWSYPKTDFSGRFIE